MMFRRPLIALLMLVAFSGCGDGEPAPFAESSQASTTSETPETTEAPTTTRAESTPTTPPSQFALGQTLNNPNGSMVTAFQLVRPAAPEAPAPEAAGTEWAAAEVQVCTGPTVPEGAFVSGQFWKLRDANNGQYDGSSTGYSQFPEPQFPIEQPVSGGECFRGWIVFPVVIGIALTAIVYTSPSIQPPFPTWTVSA